MQSPRAVPLDARLPPAGTIVGGKYRVEELLGRGGMGAVLAATHRVTGRRVALKWLLHDAAHDAELTQRLVREAQAAGRVRHENVVDVYDVGEHDGSMFLVMELLEGDTLAALLKERSLLPPTEALQILLPVMRGVQAAHNSGVIHRDLKPSNIFLSRGDGVEIKPRVLDFGVSKIGKGLGDERSLTQSGTVMGTPYYMAPEQLADGRVDVRVDVYALGVILYQCLSGRLPFAANTFSALVLQVATGEPLPLSSLRPELPPSLCGVVMQALARDPAARLPNVSALIDALLSVGRDTSELQLPPEAGQLEAKRRWLAWGLGAATIVLVLAGWWIWNEQTPTASAPSAIATPASIARPADVPAVEPAAEATPAAVETPPVIAAPTLSPVVAPAPTSATEDRTPTRRARRAARTTKPTEPVPPASRAIKVSLDQF